jgi:hypothetical protein
MNRNLWMAIVVFSLGVGIAVGWFLERRHTQSEPMKPATSSDNNRGSTAACEQAPETEWYTVRNFFFAPRKTLYNADWQVCRGEPSAQRVRITDANFETVFFQFEDDEIERVETLDFLGDHVPQLLVLTVSAGTGDQIALHVISESNGALEEWKLPDYDVSAEKLLRPDEDFCCKDWNLHVQGSEIVLARGIYHKGVDGNCCPSRGGVLVRLMPAHNAFKVVNTVRISKPEYYRWREQPFCLQCTLY